MFKIIDVVQGSDEWLEARNGILTASEFNKLVTATGNISTKWEEAVNICVAERVLGGKDEGFQNNAMMRGQSLEWDALRYFNITYDYNFSKIGFLRAKKGVDELLDYGCSPDAIDLENKIGLELKCPLSHTHVNYLLSNKLPPEYKHQVQGCLLITGFDKWIFGSYHPDLPCLKVEVERDEKYIKTLKKQLDKSCEQITIRYEKLRSML